MLSRIFHLTGCTERLSAQSYSPSAAQDADFQQKCATALNDFQLDVLGIKEILQTAGADMGLAFYDRTNDVQTLMKNVVNLHKDVLKATTILVDNIPVLGPILGPSEFLSRSVATSL